MAQHRESPPNPEIAHVPRGRAAIVALGPFVCVLAAGGVAGYSLRADVLELALILHWGIGAMSVLGATLIALPIVSVLLFFVARGVRVPTALLLALALLPWLVGMAASAVELEHVLDAVAQAHPSSRSALFVAGFPESLTGRLLGGFFSLALLMGLAFGLALASFVLQAPGRRPALAAVGALVAAPPLIVVIMGGGAFGSLATATGALAIGALAAGAIGADTHGRSGALAATAPVAAGLAVWLALVCAQSVEVVALFRAPFQETTPPGRLQMLAAGLGTSTPWAAWAALGAMGLAALVHAGLAVRQSRPSVGRVVGALAVASVTLGVVVAQTRPPRELGASLPDPYAELALVPGLALLPIRSEDTSAEPPAAVVTPEGVLDLQGASLASWSEPLAPVLRRLHEEAAVARASRERNRFGEAREDCFADADESLDNPGAGELALAFDARVGGDALASLFDAASEAGLSTVILVGVHEGFVPEHQATVGRTMPLLAAMLSPLRSIAADVSTGAPHRAGVVERYIEISASPVDILDLSPESARSARASRGEDWLLRMLATRRGESAAYVFLGARTTAPDLVRALERATDAAWRPVVVVPRDEARRRAELVAPTPDDGEDEALVEGSLDREITPR